MNIVQKFEVDGQSFDTMEDAQDYIDNNADRVRLAAFVEHLRLNGTLRISKTITDTVEEFMRFEKGQGMVPETAANAPVEETESTKTYHQQQQDTWYTPEAEAEAEAKTEVEVEVSTSPEPILFGQEVEELIEDAEIETKGIKLFGT